MAAKVGILMGSKGDMDTMKKAAAMLERFGVDHEVNVISAHRTPEKATEYAKTAKDRGIRAIIAGAGAAAHLAGVVAAHTTLPVIGVPLSRSPLTGMDALLATVQMPTGIPVATVAIDGASNAALLAIAMLALSNEELAAKLTDYRAELAAGARS